jgi:DNA-binding PadR family transcriptional regulator
MKRTHIGELEELVLLTVGSLYEQAYAVVILEVIRDQTGRKLDVTAIHSVLRRLEDKGFISSSMGGATQERGGRRKKFFVLSQAGRQVLDEVMEVRSSLYNKMPKLTFEGFSL